MSDKRFSLKYVLLEIIIVIIGISIAFWLNNWGEERKERALEIEFIKALRSDLATDSVAFATQVKYNKEGFRHLNRFVDILRNKEYENDSISWFVGRFMNRNNWILNTNTYDILKSGGKLDVISDFQLRNEMSVFYNMRGYQTNMVLDVFQKFIDNQMNPYLAKNTNYMISYNPDIDFVRDTEFQNLLVIWTDYTDFKLSVYEGTLEEIGKLMKEFDAHLSN